MLTPQYLYDSFSNAWFRRRDGRYNAGFLRTPHVHVLTHLHVHTRTHAAQTRTHAHTQQRIYIHSAHTYPRALTHTAHAHASAEDDPVVTHVARCTTCRLPEPWGPPCTQCAAYSCACCAQRAPVAEQHDADRPERSGYCERVPVGRSNR
jgi:hypothetical protein